MRSHPVAIAAAITGSVPRGKDNPAVPVSVAGRIESAHQVFEAGASLCRLHVRNEEESPSSDPDTFAAVQEGLRPHGPGMILRFSFGLEDNIRRSEDRLAAEVRAALGIEARG